MTGASSTRTSALIVGAGEGLSASLIRLLGSDGLSVAIAVRDAAKPAPACSDTGAHAINCHAQDDAQSKRLFIGIECMRSVPDVVLCNAGARVQWPFVQLGPAEI